MATHRTVYKDYLISCHVAKPGPCGLRVQIAIVCMVGDKTRSQRFIDLPDHFESEAEAIEKAVAAGVDWVDTNAQIVDRGFYVDRLLKRH